MLSTAIARSGLDLDDTLVSDSVWTKFQMDPFSSLWEDGGGGLGSTPSPFINDDDNFLILNDCMWTGDKSLLNHDHDDDDDNDNVIVDQEDRKPEILSSTDIIVKPTQILPPISRIPTTTTTTTTLLPTISKQQQQSLLKPEIRLGLMQNLNNNNNNNNNSSNNNFNSPLLSQTADLVLPTPPMSDDEDSKTTPTLRHLKDVLFEHIIDDNEDLTEYLKGDTEDFDLIDDEFDDDVDIEDEDADVGDRKIKIEIKEEPIDDGEEEEEEEASSDDASERERFLRMRACHAAESDHSYHKASHQAADDAVLGLNTPSDSEEEIDVVTFTPGKSASALPTNPSPKERHHLMRTMRSHFAPQHHQLNQHHLNQHQTRNNNNNNNNNNSPIKTLTPVRRTIKKRTATTNTVDARTIRTNPHHHHQQQQQQSRQYKRYNSSSNNSNNNNNNQSRQYNKRRYPFGTSSDTEQDPSEKRDLHNNMERQRRIDLRNLFDDLKALVPEVSKKQKAAKVMILRCAAQYCQNLTQTSRRLAKEMEELKSHQKALLAQVGGERRQQFKLRNNNHQTQSASASASSLSITRRRYNNNNHHSSSSMDYDDDCDEDDEEEEECEEEEEEYDDDDYDD